MGAHLKQLAASKGLSPEKLLEEYYPSLEPPRGLEWIFEVFEELSLARPGPMGPEPISFQQIESWSKINGVEFSFWEVNLLRLLDRIWMKAYHGRLSRTRATNPKR